MELENMTIDDVRECDAFAGDTPRATLKFESFGPGGPREETAEVFIRDVAWALHCIVDQGAPSKIHAGCMFAEDGDDVVVQTGSGGFSLSREEAGRVVDEFRPGLDR
jgi:hypothetical protein